MASRKRRNPYFDESGYDSKTIKFDEKALQAKTWAILMSPQSRRSTSNGKPTTSIRTSDSPALDTVENLNKDILMTNCVDCLKSVPETKTCSGCHRGLCDKCSQPCERCCYHYCAVCRIMNYDDCSDRLFCLTCNDDLRREALDARMLENGMDLS